MSRTSLYSSSCGDFADYLHAIKTDILRTKSCDISRLKHLPEEQLNKTLVQWRNEQLKQVQEELNLLLVIEDMVKNSDAPNFEGYTDENKLKEMIKEARGGR